MYPLKHLSLTIILGWALAISGCATKNAPMSQEEFSTALAQSSANADVLLEKGQREDAVKVLEDLAKKNPGRKDPWVRMAKIHFDGENYAQAIVAAEEALQRDNTDRTAKSIRAVGGCVLQPSRSPICGAMSNSRVMPALMQSVWPRLCAIPWARRCWFHQKSPKRKKPRLFVSGQLSPNRK
jgi:tetratricopeptide (TPR) repeat protein